MSKIIYKIKHIPTGKFIKIRLTKIGIEHWVNNKVLEGNDAYGIVLFDTHVGWKSPLEPTDEDFSKINCKIVKFKEELIEVKTSKEWQEQFPNIIVYDPDGWDRGNWSFSWFEELITKNEYDKRVMYSTCLTP